MKSYWRIVRIPNLVIMLVSMYLIRYGIMYPALNMNGMSLIHNGFLFFLLVISIVLLAAGGNVINDIQDIEADKINKPGVNVVGDLITRKQAYSFYYIITSMGLLLGLYVSLSIQSFLFFNIHIVIGLSLWMYSSRWNSIPLLGNVVVSSLLASLPWIVVFFDLPAVIFSQQTIDATFALPNGGAMDFKSYFSVILFLVLSYSMFAYVQNMAREITKDIIDYDGDKSVGYRTAPTIFGVKKSKQIILFTFLTLLTFYIIFIKLVHSYFLSSPIIWFILLGLGLVIPTLISIYLLISSKTRADFKKLSTWNKISQLIGLSTIFYFLYL